jgi:pyridoxal phosphate-dependent aminotransferase EpsN
MGGSERQLLLEAFDSNWIAPLGPHVDAFEGELSAIADGLHVAALSSGTAGLHLALLILGVGAGDEVIVSDLTFAATANAIVYTGARPRFVDSNRETWNIDPALLEEELQACAHAGRLPKAVIAVDLYGQCADYDPIIESCRRYGVPLIEDAAESLGATYRGRAAGTFGDFGVFSFNGNKVITTSGGGALVSRSAERIQRARFLATQAREPAPHYEHTTIGYNYRLSNLLAAVGRGQLRELPQRIAARRRNFDFYVRSLGSLPGITFMPEASYGESNRWLSCIQVDAEAFGATREDLRLALEAENIESRPLWKPMHLQPVFRDLPCRGGAVSAALFERGLCLPSGSALTEEQLERICSIVRGKCAAVAASGAK